MVLQFFFDLRVRFGPWCCACASVGIIRSGISGGCSVCGVCWGVVRSGAALDWLGLFLHSGSTAGRCIRVPGRGL